MVGASGSAGSPSAWADGTADAAANGGNGARHRAPRPAAGTSAKDGLATPAPEAGSSTAALLGEIAALLGADRDLATRLTAVMRVVRRVTEVRTLAYLERADDQLLPLAMDGADAAQVGPREAEAGAVGRAVSQGVPSWGPVEDGSAMLPGGGHLPYELVVPLGRGQTALGVLLADDEDPGRLLAARDALVACAAQLELALRDEHRLALVRRRLDLAEALARIGADIGSKLDLRLILSESLDHAMVLFGADRGAVYRRISDGTFEAQATRNLSTRYLQAVRRFPAPSLAAEVLASGRIDFAVDYANDPRGAGVRAAVVQEGYDTAVAAPLMVESGVGGLLALYHDTRHPWAPDELEALDALAAQVGNAITNADHYAQTTTWAAQLQSIQQLGVRLNRLRSVQEIGNAIALELRQLIDYHNVRVYRVEGDDVLPVAWHGEIGEYENEVEEQLRLRVGQGITGWVAEHGVAQYLPDADLDPRTQTIVGTEEHLSESLLVAPMVYEDRVLGVIVLSKLGLDQFSHDDLRLLEIYASFAAQAISNASATEQLHAKSAALERQLRGQRELLRISKSLLTSLDAGTVFDAIADGLGNLVSYDNLALELHDAERHLIQPIVTRGPHRQLWLERPLRDDEGVGGWVVQHGEPQLVLDERLDPRVRHFDQVEAGSLMVVPLEGRERIAGVMTLERLGESAAFSEEEFELVQLFAAQASVALQNAQAHQLVELRAQTDGLTSLANHATFQDQLARAVSRGERFSLLMVDLDDFKVYNDSLGHQAGDRLLRAISRALESAGRETDRVFRYGGDEFTLLLPGTDANGACLVAERIRTSIHGAGEVLGQREALLPTSSIGIATFPDDGRTPEEVLLAADRACYVSKRGGRDRITTAEGGRELVREFELTVPTPVDAPEAGESPAAAS